jgi:hypothetical protein
MATDIQKEFEEREGYRKQIRGLMVEAYNNEQFKKFRAFQDMLENDLQYDFKELAFKPQYVKALKNNYFQTTGETFDKNTEGLSIHNLIEQDFEHWNMIDGSLIAGGVEMAKAFGDMSDDVKANNLSRWQTYINTPSFGEHSRDFVEQAKGVGKGVALDVAATAGFGITTNIGKNLLGKTAARGFITKALSTRTKVAGTGALYGMVADVERQGTEIGLGGKEDYDVGQGLTSAAIGAVAPTVMGPVGTMIGKTGRAATHMGQSLGTTVKSLTGGYGATAAARGVTRESAEAIGKYSSSEVGVGASNFQANLKLGLGNTHKYYQDAFDAIPLENINPVGVRNIVQRWNKTKGMILPDKAKQIMAKLDAKTITPIQALRELKKVLWREGRDAEATVSDSATLHGFRKELINMEEIAAFNQGHGKQYLTLKKGYGEFNELLKTRMGKLILSASEDPVKAGALVKSMAFGDFSWNNLRQFQLGVKKALKGTGNEEVAVNLNKNIRTTMSNYLLEKDGQNLIRLISGSQKGLQTLKRIYPDDVVFWDRMQELSARLGGKKGGASSVVMNMAIARVGAQVGGTFSPKAGSAAGAIGGISLVNTLVQRPFFQKAMEHAYLRAGGRMSTGTRTWLETQGYSKMEVQNIQDTLWGLMGTGFAMGSLDDIWEDYGKEPAKRKIEEIKAGYVW